MKGLILAGGRGSRLRPLTHTGPKQLLPVANRPILFYVLDSLVNAGITDVVVVLSPETGSDICAAVEGAAEWAATITFVVQPEPRGLADAVRVARPALGDEDFCMFLGDNLVGEDLRPHLAAFEADPGLAASLFLKEVDDPRQFGVAEVDDDGRLLRLVEKPLIPASNLALVGIYLFRSTVHAAIATLQPSARGELEITDAISRLLADGHRVRCTELVSWWLDTGKKDDLLRANTVLLETFVTSSCEGDLEDSTLEGAVRIEAGARLVRSRVIGPAVIGAAVTLVDAQVGPSVSLGAGSSVERAIVRHSVLGEGARVADVPLLVDSVLGRRAQVTGTGRGPQLLLGDDSIVELGVR